jgi:diguanylate cyclase (GGDEF)-like protein
MLKLFNYLEKYIKIIIFPESKYFKNNVEKRKFHQNTFKHNNSFILILSYFLFLEQLYYSFLVRAPGSLYQKIHLTTALIMFVFGLIATYLFFFKKIKSALFNRLFNIFFGVTGFVVAIVRTIIFQDSSSTLTTIYLAVNYGLAVIIYLKPIVSVTIYITAASFLVYFSSIFHPNFIFYSYAPDVFSNAIIACIVSVVNYHRHLKSFVNKLKVLEINRKLKKISSRDALTDLYNRRKLDEFLKLEFNRSKQSRFKFSVTIIDIDDFKAINDNYGHNIGDQVLMKFSQILESNIRAADKLGRWGGEEFLLITPETDLNGAFQLAEKLRKAISKHQFKVVKNLSASFGVAEFKSDESVYHLVNRADTALYQAKANGKNEVVVNS